MSDNIIRAELTVQRGTTETFFVLIVANKTNKQKKTTS